MKRNLTGILVSITVLLLSYSVCFATPVGHNSHPNGNAWGHDKDKNKDKNKDFSFDWGENKNKDFTPPPRAGLMPPVSRGTQQPVFRGNDPCPSAAPEPATMLLLGTGLAGLAGARLRRKKK